MILIHKGSAPNSLIEYRRAFNAYYGGLPKEDRDDIRDQLLAEQGHLCAYCMRRIYKDTMKIEHWYPEDRMTDQECLDYSRMLGCCPGHNQDDDGKQDTCDTHKRNTVIAIKPTESSHIARIKYRSRDGEILSDKEKQTVIFRSENGTVYEDITTFDKDINETLNLNEETHYLKQGRKAVLDEVIAKIQKKKKDSGWTAKDLRTLIKEYEQADADGYKKPYAGIVLWYLNKKIKQL